MALVQRPPATVNLATSLMAAPAPPRDLAPDFEVARRMHRKYGKSYYFATRLLPRPTRLATHALYAFFRVPDEIVDNSPLRDTEDAYSIRRRLVQWQSDWERAYRSGDAADPVLRATAHVFHQYRIPYEYSEYFLAAMLSDLEKNTYRTYDELQQYMFGSAAVVGMMMTYVIGYSDSNALQYARKLGYAMQLTNFLRDIDEDYRERGRIYMPQDELAAYNVSPQDIAERRFSPALRAFTIFQCARAHELYHDAARGVPLLNREGRFPVRVAAQLYGAILDKLALQDWNVFAGRARTNTVEKFALTMRVYREHRLN